MLVLRDFVFQKIFDKKSVSMAVSEVAMQRLSDDAVGVENGHVKIQVHTQNTRKTHKNPTEKSLCLTHSAIVLEFCVCLAQMASDKTQPTREQSSSVVFHGLEAKADTKDDAKTPGNRPYAFLVLVSVDSGCCCVFVRVSDVFHERARVCVGHMTA